MIKIEQADGLEFQFPASDKAIGTSLITAGEFCRAEIALLSDLYPGHGAIIDVGANIGIMTLGLAKRFPTATVYAFEASPVISVLLRSNVERSGLTNVRNFSCAVGLGGTVEFPTPRLDEPLNFGAIGRDTPSAPSALKTVQCVRLDDAVSEPVGLIKIDVEGMEAEVFEGTRNIIRRDRPSILFENNANTREICLSLPDYHFAYFFSPWVLPLNPKNYPVAGLNGDLAIVCCPVETVIPWGLSTFTDTIPKNISMSYLDRFVPPEFGKPYASRVLAI